jgi:O-antigen ligase
VLAVLAMASVAVGAVQMVGGEQSSWYFYEITNHGASVGFFANANHLATLLIVTIPFLAALYSDAIARGRSVQRSSGLFVVLAGTFIIVSMGLVTNRSIAGLGLAIPVLTASLMMIFWRKRRIPPWSLLLVALLMVASVTASFSTPFGNNLTSESARGSEDSRYTSFTRTLKASVDYLPVGSGLGSFPEIYRAYEPHQSVTRYYMNHVHGDYIELALETGVPGLTLIFLFLLWWLRRTIATWRAKEPDYFARAATIGSAAILAHSAVDYPLRSAAISAVLAMCCALISEPRAKARRKRQSEEDASPAARHLSAD